MSYFYGSVAYDNSSISTLSCSFSVILSFVLGYLCFKTFLRFEIGLYIFLMFVGVGLVAYGTYLNGPSILSSLSIPVICLLMLSTSTDSVSYVLVKLANKVPTFVLVFSQAVFCGIVGLILMKMDGNYYQIQSMGDMFCISALGVIAFFADWAYIRGTQLISIGVASFLKNTNYILWGTIIHFIYVDVPSFYSVFGV
eukprot:98374_1